MSTKHPHKQLWKHNEWSAANRLHIPVGDLLHKQGSKDIVSLDGLYLGEEITNFVWVAQITSVSDDELYVTIKNASYTISTVCDYCGMLYLSHKQLPEESYSFMLEHVITPEMQEEEAIFPIGSDMVIDLEPLLQEMIWLASDVQHACVLCRDRLSAVKDEDDELPDSWLTSSIVFT